MFQPSLPDLFKFAVLEAEHVLPDDGVLVGVLKPVQRGVPDVARNRTDCKGGDTPGCAVAVRLVQISYDYVRTRCGNNGAHLRTRQIRVHGPIARSQRGHIKNCATNHHIRQFRLA